MSKRKSRIPVELKIKIAYEVLLAEDDDMSTEQLLARIEDMTGADLAKIIDVLASES